jgi:hypothetical protein
VLSKFLKYAQEDLNKVYEKLPFDLGQAHSEMLWGIATAFFFQRLFPISSFFALGLTISCYYCQKIRLAKLSKRPNYHTEDVGRSTLFVLNMMPGVYGAGLMVWDNCTIGYVDPLTWVICAYGLVIILYPPYVQLTKWEWFQRLVRKILKLGECEITDFSYRSLRTYFIHSRIEEAKKLWRYNLHTGPIQIYQLYNKIVDLKKDIGSKNKFTEAEKKKLIKDKESLEKQLESIGSTIQSNAGKFKLLQPFEPHEFDQDRALHKIEVEMFSEEDSKKRTKILRERTANLFKEQSPSVQNAIWKSRRYLYRKLKYSADLVNVWCKKINEYSMNSNLIVPPTPHMTKLEDLNFNLESRLREDPEPIAQTMDIKGIKEEIEIEWDTFHTKNKSTGTFEFDPFAQHFNILYDEALEALERQKPTYRDGAYKHYMDFEKPIVPFSEMNKHFTTSYERVNPVTADEANITYMRKRAGNFCCNLRALEQESSSRRRVQI